MSGTVLVVDGDSVQREWLGRLLAGRGYAVHAAADARDAIARPKAGRLALVVMALDPAHDDAMERCYEVRQGTGAPLLVLSRDQSSLTEVMALEAGADDYVLAPPRPEALVARIRALLRRSGEMNEETVIGAGPFRIDLADRRVRVRGQSVRLTPKEFELFAFMAARPNRVLTHRTLLGAVWGAASQEQSEYLRVFVGQLRRKLETDPTKPRHLVTEPWVGYRFVPDGVQ